MTDPEKDPEIKLALELAERGVAPDYPDYRKGFLGALAGAALFLAGAVFMSMMLSFIRSRSGSAVSGMPLWSIIGLTVVGALLGGGYFAFRPPVGK